MRILVLSDSHGRAGLVEEIIEKNPEAEHIFFLGDVLRDLETAKLLFTDKKFYAVAGNCDFYADCPSEATARLGGVKIFYCHGHTLGVKYGTERLFHRAAAEQADLVLYGHTHQANIAQQGECFMVNPGSVAQARNSRNSYAVIDIDEKGIFPSIVLVE
ncbi:MAG: metallophosphoesterase [Clostridia bacterium]|nr:metallophosphoesterase [Clostridia bacterium]